MNTLNKYVYSLHLHAYIIEVSCIAVNKNMYRFPHVALSNYVLSLLRVRFFLLIYLANWNIVFIFLHYLITILH